MAIELRRKSNRRHIYKLALAQEKNSFGGNVLHHFPQIILHRFSQIVLLHKFHKRNWLCDGVEFFLLLSFFLSVLSYAKYCKRKIWRTGGVAILRVSRKNRWPTYECAENYYIEKGKEGKRIKNNNYDILLCVYYQWHVRYSVIINYVFDGDCCTKKWQVEKNIIYQFQYISFSDCDF